MSISTTFEEITVQENAVFTKTDHKYKGDRGASVYSSKYTLECRYRGSLIVLTNEFGHQNIGSVICELSENPRLCEFNIETIDSFFQLLNRKRNPLKLITQDEELRRFIVENAAYQELIKRARKDRFEPSISGKKEEGRYIISCDYHLVFHNQGLVVAPLIQLVKALADFFSDTSIRSQTSPKYAC